MITDLYDLERAYADFLKQHVQTSKLSGVEYIGVNFSDDIHVPVVFKAYYSTSRSAADLPVILQPFRDREMIRALNKIEDTVNRGRIRYEIGLAKRTNENMLWVYHWVTKLHPEINVHLEIIRKMTQIKCCDSPIYRYAAMYFLGIIADLKEGKPPEIEAVKLHYLLRMCQNPDKIGKNYSLNTKEYIAVLKEIHIPAFLKLTDIIEELLDNVLSELWMAAVDFYRSGDVKYKIYIKKIPWNLYDFLILILENETHSELSDQVRLYREWITLHPELERYGLAVCLTETGHWSLNFYH